MKKAIFVLVALVLFAAPSLILADQSEKVDIVKFDSVNNDMIVQRSTGERLLLQHNRICRSMSLQFPVYLIWQGTKLVDIKVAPNEQCEVYNWGPYTSDVKILSRTPSITPLVTEHLAQIEWEGDKYEIDYGTGCSYLRDAVGRTAYLSAPKGTLDGATLYLPQDLGQCVIKKGTFVEQLASPHQGLAPLQNIKFKAENNGAIFYWEAMTTDENWVYLISRSVRPIDPADYTYLQMPMLRYSQQNTFTATTLANERDYYFYLSARNNKGEVLPWTEMKVRSTRTVYVPENKPDPEPFEIFMKEETDDHYILSWPDKSENSSRYLIQFYIDGKRELFKIIPSASNEYKIEKTSKVLAAKGYRFTLKSIAKKRFGATYSDSHYWVKEKAK